MGAAGLRPDSQICGLGKKAFVVLMAVAVAITVAAALGGGLKDIHGWSTIVLLLINCQDKLQRIPANQLIRGVDLVRSSGYGRI